MVPIAAQQAFYEASAQVIPVLLLVLAVEVVRYRAPQESVWVAYSFMGIVLGMLFGEVAALATLAAGHDTILSAMWTSIGIGVGASAVFLRAGLLARDNLRKERSDEIADRFELVITIAATVVMVGVTLTLLAIAS